MKNVATCLKILLAPVLVWAMAISTANADEGIRLGVLKFGTVNWELAALKHHEIDKKNGFELEVVPFAGKDASTVAFLGGDVDAIVTDWLWVSRMRAEGRDYTFVPYSSAVGAIMVSGDSDLKTLADLKGKKIGVAGGPLDKSWLMIKGLAQRDLNVDLGETNDVVFGKPPLLAKKAEQGELDAVLNFWHYSARLEAKGFRRLISAADAAGELGGTGPVSTIGYVFSEKWARDNPEQVAGFVAASRETKALLKDSDDEWQRLHDDGKIKDKGKALTTLRDRFREGIPSRPLADEKVDAAAIYDLLAELGGNKLVGSGAKMAEGTYWSGLKNGS
ncbi:MAG: ABC transporter substrate-binding protein [Stappiaceae bacterium]